VKKEPLLETVDHSYEGEELRCQQEEEKTEEGISIESSKSTRY